MATQPQVSNKHPPPQLNFCGGTFLKTVDSFNLQGTEMDDPGIPPSGIANVVLVSAGAVFQSFSTDFD